MEVFQIVILAGGLATRLRPVTETIPKSLIEIAGEPFISYQLRLLKSKGIDNVVLCVGYLGEKIQDYVGNGEKFGLEVSYSFDGPTLLGTGGSIKKALPMLGNTFFVLYGDSYLDINYKDVNKVYRKAGKSGLMTVIKNDDRWDSSNIFFADGEVISYDKKNKSPEMKYIDYGLGILTQNAFDEFSELNKFDLSLVYQNLIKKRDLSGYVADKRFYEIGSIEGIKDTEEYIKSRE